jgi:Xaa-Pro aminopeptidase
MARKSIQRDGDPLYPEHPLEEHRWRLERTRRIMREDGLDALVCLRNINVVYYTGSRFVFVQKDAPTVVAPQSAAVITPDADIYCQRFGPFDTDAVPLHTSVSQSIECYDSEFELVNILRDYGIKAGDRVGTEWGPALTVGVNPLKFIELEKRLRDELGVELVDGTKTINRAMAVKSPLEIARMRVAVQAAARAMDRIIDTMRIGMNELEVARLASQFMIEEGADSPAAAQVNGDGDGSIRVVSCKSVDRTLEAGWVHLDIGCKYFGYTSDINRDVLLGRRPTRQEEQLYECRQGMNELMDRMIKPGVAIDAVLEAMAEYAASRGCLLQRFGTSLFGGHGIGLEIYQPPSLLDSELQPEFKNGNEQVLFEPGMMFAYEMPLSLPGLDAFVNVEDDVVVTEDGVENMNAMLTRDMRVKLN